MEEEKALDKFTVLEDKFNTILDGYMVLKEEKERFSSTAREQEIEIERLRAEVSALKVERSEIRARVERLIERLEGIPLES